MQKSLLAVSALSLSLPLSAQTWTEVGDAGDLPATAQATSGCGSLTQIDGTITAGDVDMYLIRITDPANFSCTTVAGTTLDTQLWLFDTAGVGVSFDDDSPNAPGLQSTLTGQFVPAPGLYLVAISTYNNDAQDSLLQLLWNNTPFNVERQPDGPGAVNPVNSWTGSTTAGTYSMFLTGAALSTATNQLTTPPLFVANNQGSVGGAVYFTLDVTNPAGVTISGISISTTAAAGSALDGLLFMHRTITDVNALTALNRADWCPLGTISGTSAGSGVASPCTISNGTNTLELAQGQYLLGIGGGNFANRYTNGTGLNQVIADANMQFTGGKASNATLSGSLFNPRIANLTFDYCVGASGTTACGAFATCTTAGSGCGGAPAHVHELFTSTLPWDLSTTDLLITGAGIIPVPQSPIVPPVAPSLGLSDDSSSPFIPLGFTCAIGGDLYSQISACSNGYIRFDGASSATDFSESAAEFYAQGARLAPYWNDLNPGAGGTVHIDINPGLAIVTYQGVFLFGTTTPLTFQVEISPTSILYRYDPTSAFASSALVGYANGTPEPVLPAVDLSAGPTGPLLGASTLTLSCDSTPLLGTSIDVTLNGNPSLGAALAEIGLLGPGVPLPVPPFGAGCTQYISNNHVSLGITTGASQQFSIPIPNNIAFVNIPFALQGVSLGSGSVIVTNGVQARTGNF